MREREERIARNEALFRNVNERVRDLAEGLTSEAETGAMAFVCECGSGDCTASVQLTIPEYERVRSDPTTFFIVVGHEIREVENVVEHHEGYDIVSKRDEGAQIAIETDPRS